MNASALQQGQTTPSATSPSRLLLLAKQSVVASVVALREPSLSSDPEVRKVQQYHKPLELNQSWHGFFTDIFRFKNTIHMQVFPQVLLG